MKTTVYYYTGSGNSLWVARTLAAHLGETELRPIAKQKGPVDVSGTERVGLVFPVHMWGSPPLVRDFVARIRAERDTWFFAVAVNAGAVAATLVDLKKRLRRQGLSLASGYSVIMPSIYLPFGDIVPEEKQKEMFQKAEKKIGTIAGALEERRVLEVEKGPLWQNLVFGGLNALVMYQVPKMDRSFEADETCTSCGICVKVCPVDNIVLTEGRPEWLHHCEQCYACLHWCPEEAIQYGKSTVGKKRYHHPDIELKDIVG
jgi:ferredoxin